MWSGGARREEMMIYIMQETKSSGIGIAKKEGFLDRVGEGNGCSGVVVVVSNGQKSRRV